MKMKTREQELNRDLIVGWALIVAVLFVAYLGEVVKGERTLAYCFVFMVATGLPAFLCWLGYRRNPLNRMLRYWIVAGYFIMYLFVVFSGNTILVFTYILPLLSFLILYHQPSLVAATGVVAVLINVVLIIQRVVTKQLTLQNSRDDEIRMALLILCFLGCYVGAKLYDRIYHENEAYVQELNAKSQQIQEMTLQTIETIANTIDAKDEYTKGHSRRVSEYSAAIARQMGMDDEEIMQIRYIALLHDIGKIGVPDFVLNKPGKLTDAEYELMKEHTVIGSRILKDIGMFSDLDLGARCHHERYDGKGYPNGLKGDEIPFIARIIGVADAFDAMTSNRVYRKHLTKEKVLEELKRCRGTQFDPQVTDAFLEYLDGLSDWNLEEKPEEQEHTEENASGRLLRKIIDDRNEQTRRDKELDELTGVYNRSVGERKVRTLMQDTYGCFLLANIDNMRRINCELGYRSGDAYIQFVAARLLELATDIVVSRFGGDEFMCFLPQVTDAEKVQMIFEDFQKEIAYARQQDEAFGSLSVSVGITLYDRPDKDFSELLLEAEKALYYVKQQNKNSYYLYKEDKGTEEEVHSKQDENQLRELCRSLVKSNGGSGKDTRVILFTAKLKDEHGVSVEEREEAMRIIDYVIVNELDDKEAFKKYSSVQRAVIITGADAQMNQMTDAITRNFYKIYDKKNVELYYDVIDIKDDN